MHDTDILCSLYSQVDHENWCLIHKSYHNQRHSILQAWSRDRRDLLAKIEAIFSDAWEAHEQNLEKKLAMQQQEKICHELYAKVLCTVPCINCKFLYEKKINLRKDVKKQK